MNEEDLKKVVDSIIEPMKEQHLLFMETILKQMQIAFEKGVEIGQKLKDN